MFTCAVAVLIPVFVSVADIREGLIFVNDKSLIAHLCFLVVQSLTQSFRYRGTWNYSSASVVGTPLFCHIQHELLLVSTLLDDFRHLIQAFVSFVVPDEVKCLFS